MSQQRTTKSLIAQSKSVSVDMVDLLGITVSVSNPKGYALKLNLTGIYSIKKPDNGAEYCSSPAFYAVSIRDVGKDEAMRDMCEAEETRKHSVFELPDEQSGNFWISTEYAKSKGIEVDNVFTNYVYLMGEKGSFNGLDYDRGDTIVFNAMNHIGKPNPAHISHFRPSELGVPSDAKVKRFDKWVNFS